MEFVCNFMTAEAHPATWARQREAEGWDLISVADHFFSSTRPFPHVWVTAAAMAQATDTVGVTTAFVNNLFRSPVEVAQAALEMQMVAEGRFELGLGAGWAREEIEAAGMVYPSPGLRAGAYAESAEVVRSLIHSGSCHFSGEHYQIDIDMLGPLSPTPPLLVGSVGGPRTIREVTPHCDRVELKPASAATRDGAVDMELMAAVRDDDLIELIARVRDVDPDIELGVFLLCNVADDARTNAIASSMGDGLYHRFFGSAEKFADGIAWLESVGISRCQISPFDDSSFDRLAPVLFR